jgi:hypothetical protein
LDKTLAQYSLNFSASHRPSAGDVLVGTSTDTIAAFSVSPVYIERWSWGLSLRYGHRTPDLAAQNPLDSIDLEGSVGRALGRRAGLGLSSSLLTQEERGGDELDIVTWRTTLSLSFSPFGRSPADRGGSVR